MKRFLIALVLSFVLSTALALEVSSGSKLILTTGDGTVVGVGALDDNTLELDLLANVNDFAQLTITDAEGNTVSYDVMFDSNGNITLVESFANLTDTLAAAGIEVKVSYKDAADLAQRTAEDAEDESDDAEEEDELERAREATEGNERANSGLDRAQQARNNAADEDESEDAEEEAREEAERAAEQAQEQAERAAEEAEKAAERAAEEAERAAEEAAKATERVREEAERAADRGGDADEDEREDASDEEDED